MWLKVFKWIDFDIKENGICILRFYLKIINVIKDFINCIERIREIIYILFDILFLNRRCRCSYIVTLHFNWIFYLSYHLHKNVSPDSSILCLHEMLGSDRVLQLLRLSFGVWNFSWRSILSIQLPVASTHSSCCSDLSLVLIVKLLYSWDIYCILFQTLIFIHSAVY